MHATDGIRRTGSSRHFGRSWPLADVAVASLGLALLIACFLMFRRATGALSGPLPGSQLAATAVVLLVWALLVQLLVARKTSSTVAYSLLFCVLLLFALACSYPATRLIDWLVWVPTIGTFLFAKRLATSARRIRERVPLTWSNPVLLKFDSNENEQVLQQLTRYRSTAGQDVVRGSVAAIFEAGERTSTLYVAFCPPFERLPKVDVEVVDDPSAVAKLAQVLHNGIQLEVRLTKPAQARHSLPVEFFAAEPVELP
jgi:hypothetical protein